MRDLKYRLLPGQLIQISTDGFGVYPQVIDALWRGNVDYGQSIKDCSDMTSEDQRRYSLAHCKVVEKKAVRGDPDPDFISTSYVER